MGPFCFCGDIKGPMAIVTRCSLQTLFGLELNHSNNLATRLTNDGSASITKLSAGMP